VNIVADWPKSFLEWREGDTLCISVPFTWSLPAVYQRIVQREFDQPRRVKVGGPATMLMPEYLNGSGAEVGGDIPGVLQRHNPQATRSTQGCPRRCSFCAVPRVEGAFRELEDWPDLPVYCDNNILKAGQAHLDRVFDRLEKHGWCDFNQGLDARLLNDYHAERLKRVGHPICRLALDRTADKDSWERAYGVLRKRKIPKNAIRSYVLVGFDSGPEDAWDRCKWVTDHGVKALPQWFHELDALENNVVTAKQEALGWTDYKRREIMQWYYQHKRAVS
jgi:hypothetical protein